MTVQKKKDSSLLFGAIVACYAVYVSMKLRVLPSKRKESVQDLPFLSVYNNSKTRVVSLSRIRSEFKQHIENFRKRIRNDVLAPSANFVDLSEDIKNDIDDAAHFQELDVDLPEIVSTPDIISPRGKVTSVDDRDRSRTYIPKDSPKATKVLKTPPKGLQKIFVSPPCKGVPGIDEESSDSIEMDMTPVSMPAVRRELIIDTPNSSSVKLATKNKRRSSSVGDASTVQATLKHQQIQELLRQHTDQALGRPKQDTMVRREGRGHLLRADNKDQWRSQSIDDMYQEISEELVRQKRMADDEENSDEQGSPVPVTAISHINAKERRVSFRQTTPPGIQRASTHDNLWKKSGKDAQLETMQTMNNDMSLQIENLQRQLDMMKDSVHSGIDSEMARSRADMESVMSYEPSLVISRHNSERKPEFIAGDPRATLAPTTPALDTMSPGAMSDRADSVFMVGSAPGISWLGLTAGDAANSEMDDTTRREIRGNLATRENIRLYRDQSIRRELGDMEKEVRRLEMNQNDSNRREIRGNLATRSNIGLYRDQSIRRELTDMESEVRRLRLENSNDESKPVFRKFQMSNSPCSAISSRRSSVVPEAGKATSSPISNDDVCMTQLDIAHIYIEELMKKVAELEEKLEAVSGSSINPLMRPGMNPNESCKRMPSTVKPNMGPVSLIHDEQWELESDLPEAKNTSFV